MERLPAIVARVVCSQPLPAERISFRQVNRETGNRLRQQLVDTVTGDIVESPDRGRGYEVGPDQLVVVPDEDLRTARQEARTRPFSDTVKSEQEPPSKPSLKLVDNRRQAEPPEPEPEPVAAPIPRPIVENTHIIELDRFIASEEVDARYLLAPYYIVPRDDSGLEAFAVIREAMAAQGLVGMGRVVLTNRERPLIVEPMGWASAASRCTTPMRFVQRQTISPTSHHCRS
jgi:DNA end-binding protein Ku